jgi:TonB-linked SusC/RagA family outer membrane protein
MSCDASGNFMARAWRGLAAPFGAFVAIAIMAFATTSPAQGQEAVISGTVHGATGAPLPGVQVMIEALQATSVTGSDGTYRLVIPEARLAGRTVLVTLLARSIGFRSQSVNLTAQTGSQLTQDFVLVADPFLLEAVVVTGQGLQAQRVKLGATINTVRAEEMQLSNETNVVAALAGKAPNVEVTKSSADPGAGTYIRIRGAKSITGGTQPLFVVDGTPIANESHEMDHEPQFPGTGATAYQNRAADLNVDDIESVQILKGAAASSIYGSRAANGVVLITTKSGQRNATQVTLKTSTSINRVNNLPALQTRWGQGLADPDNPTVNISPTSSITYGPELAPGTPVFDHAGEMFETGVQTDNTISLAGGTDRTTYYLSVGYLYHDGTIKGNSNYERITTRLKGAHDFLDNLTVGASISYTSSSGDLVQQGSNISGMLLAAFRTPPEFNNCLPDVDPCYVSPETGFHRSYRSPNPTTLVATRGYDNPFWVSNEIVNTADVDRTFGNINIDYTPFPWLSLRYLLGADFAKDDRLTVFPKSSSTRPDGLIDKAELVDEVFDHNLLATVQHTFSPDFATSVTVGQNLNQTKFRRFQVDGFNLIFGAEQTEFAIDRVPREFESKVRTEGYFAEANLDLFEQLYLKGGVRYDGSNTFGGDVDPETGKGESSRFWYPRASLAWDFTQYVNFVDFAKIRAAYGVSGTQPPIFSNISSFQTGNFFDGWIGTGFNSIYRGFEGLFSEATLGNTAIEPERTREFEAGIDFAALDNRVSMGVTYYNQKTDDAIIQLPVPPSTGFSATFENGAEFSNNGVEVTLDVLPVETRNFSWRLSGQWAKNNSNVDTLFGAENVFLRGFSSMQNVLVQDYPYPVLYGADFVRLGRGVVVGADSIDAVYSGWQPGDLYIDASGFPVEDPQARPVGDPNPDWTGSIRSTFTLFRKVRVSGLIDIKKGGQMWNGTKGAVFYFGKHAETAPIHEFADTTFATCTDCGPGAGSQVTLNWDNYGSFGVGNGFFGPSQQFIEDAGFVKLRDVSVAFTLDGKWLNTVGFNTLDVTLSGRNLVTWTDYTGLDPESNLTGQGPGRGLEYFNHPQTRSFVFTFTLRR